MTKAKLEKLGIRFVGTKRHPLYYIPGIGDIVIPENCNDILHIFSLIFESGREQGNREGKLEKINELRQLLRIKLTDGEDF